jgi:hypothetical protein
MSHIPASSRNLQGRFARFLQARGFTLDENRPAWTKRGLQEWAVITMDEQYPAVHLKLYACDGRLAAKSTVDLDGTDEGDWDNVILPFDQVFDLPFED